MLQKLENKLAPRLELMKKAYSEDEYADIQTASWATLILIAGWITMLYYVIPSLGVLNAILFSVFPIFIYIFFITIAGYETRHRIYKRSLMSTEDYNSTVSREIKAIVKEAEKDFLATSEPVPDAIKNETSKERMNIMLDRRY